MVVKQANFFASSAVASYVGEIRRGHPGQFTQYTIIAHQKFRFERNSPALSPCTKGIPLYEGYEGDGTKGTA